MSVELDQSASSAAYEPVPVLQDGTARRFWSVRRIPAALLALAVAGGAGLLLYDIAAVRAERPAMRWRRSLAAELAGRPVDSGWVLAGAACAVLLGAWLLLLALTPGLRGLLTMRGGAQGLRAGLDRSAAGLLLRDRALEVPGVQSVRVGVGRRKVVVRALAHFRELDDVRADLDAALGAALGELGLARAPGMAVRVTRPKGKG